MITIENEMNEHDTHTVGPILQTINQLNAHTVTQSLPAALDIHPIELQTPSAGKTSLFCRFNTMKQTSNTIQMTNNKTDVARNVFR